MIWYVLGTVFAVFGGVGLLVFIALSSNRGISAPSQIPTPSATGPSVIKTKWYEYLGWGFFGIIIIDIFFRRVFGQLPIEWKEWLPSFSWNTFEILAVLVGVFILWNKREKKEDAQRQGGSGIVVTNIPYAHNSPQIMYNGVRQIKWISSVGESVWNAFAIPLVIIAIIVGVFYFANEMTGLTHLRAWAMTPASLSMGLMVLLATNAIMAFLHKSDCFPVLVIGIFVSIIGYVVFQENWFTVHTDTNWWLGTTVPAIAVMLPAVMLSCYALWKSDFTDWRVPGAFLVLFFFAFF